jgi:hypothetical protein
MLTGLMQKPCGFLFTEETSRQYGCCRLVLFHSIKPEGHGAAPRGAVSFGRKQLFSRKKAQKAQKEAVA